MPSPIVDPESDLKKCPQCKHSWGYSQEFCLCAVDSEPCIALTQAELDALLAEKNARIAALEAALDPFAACGESIPDGIPNGLCLWPTENHDGIPRPILAAHVRHAARVRGAK